MIPTTLDIIYNYFHGDISLKKKLMEYLLSAKTDDFTDQELEVLEDLIKNITGDEIKMRLKYLLNSIRNRQINSPVQDDVSSYEYNEYFPEFNNQK